MEPDEYVCVKFKTELLNQITMFKHDVDDQMFSYVAALHVFAKHFNGKPITPQIRTTWNDLMRSVLTSMLSIENGPNDTTLLKFAKMLKSWRENDSILRELEEDIHILYDLCVNGSWSAQPLQCLLAGTEVDIVKLTECLCKETPLMLLIRYNILQQKSVFLSLENLITAAIRIEKFKKSSTFQETLQTHVAFHGEDQEDEKALNLFTNFDLRATMELICKFEKAGEQEKMLKVCNCVLFCMWRTGSLYSIIEMTTKWCKINFAKQGSVCKFVTFVQRSMKGNKKPCTVTHCLILMQVVWEMIKEPAYSICVEILVHALNLLKKEDDPGNQSRIKILQTISQLLPLSKIARLCLLSVFLLNPCTDTYFAVEKVFASPVKKAELQMDLQTEIVISIDSQLLYQADSLDWDSIKGECMSLLLPEDLIYIESTKDLFTIPRDSSQRESCAACKVIGKKSKQSMNITPQENSSEQDHKKKLKHGWPCPVDTCKLVTGRMWYLSQHLKVKHEWKKDEIETFIRSHGVKKTAVWMRNITRKRIKKRSSVDQKKQDSPGLELGNDDKLMSKYPSTSACHSNDGKGTCRVSREMGKVPDLTNQQKGLSEGEEQEGGDSLKCFQEKEGGPEETRELIDQSECQKLSYAYRKDELASSHLEKCSTSLKWQDQNNSENPKDATINGSHDSSSMSETFRNVEKQDLNDMNSNLLCNESESSTDSNQVHIDTGVLHSSSVSRGATKHDARSPFNAIADDNESNLSEISVPKLVLQGWSNDLEAADEAVNPSYICPAPKCYQMFVQPHTMKAHINLRHKKYVSNESKIQQCAPITSNHPSRHEKSSGNFETYKFVCSRGWYNSVDVYIQAYSKDENLRYVETNLSKSIDESLMFLFGKKLPHSFDKKALLSHLHSVWKGFTEKETETPSTSHNVTRPMNESKSVFEEKLESTLSSTPKGVHIVSLSKQKLRSLHSVGISIQGDKESNDKEGIRIFGCGNLPTVKIETQNKLEKITPKPRQLNQGVQTLTPGELHSGKYHEIVCKIHSKVKKLSGDKPKSNPSPTILMGIGFRKVPQRTIASQTIHPMCQDPNTDGKNVRIIHDTEDLIKEKMKKISLQKSSIKLKPTAKKRTYPERDTMKHPLLPDHTPEKKHKNISFEEALMDSNLIVKPQGKMNPDHGMRRESRDCCDYLQEAKSKVKSDDLYKRASVPAHCGLLHDSKEGIEKKKQKRSCEEYLKDQEWKSELKSHSKRNVQSDMLEQKMKEKKLSSIQKSEHFHTQEECTPTPCADQGVKIDTTIGSKSQVASPHECFEHIDKNSSDRKSSEMKINSTLKSKIICEQDFEHYVQSEMNLLKRQNTPGAEKDKSNPGVNDLHDYKNLLKHAQEQQLHNVTTDDKAKNGFSSELLEKGIKTNTDPSILEASKVKLKSKRCIKLRSLSNATPSIEITNKEYTEMRSAIKDDHLDDFTSDASTSLLCDDDTKTPLEFSCSLCGRTMVSAFALACHKRKKHKSKAKMFIPEESAIGDIEEVEKQINPKRKPSVPKNVSPVHTERQTENASCAQENIPLRNKNVSTYPTTDRICDKLILTLYLASFRNMVDINCRKMINEDFYELYSVLFTRFYQKYDCPFCDKVLVNRRSFRRHTHLYHQVDMSELVAALVLLANTNKLKQCSICQIDFGKFQTLEKHFLNSHCDKHGNPLNCKTRLPRLLCHVCHKISFFNVLSLTRHININHNLTISQLKTSGHFEAMLRKAVTLGLPIQVPAWLDVVKGQDENGRDYLKSNSALELKPKKEGINNSSMSKISSNTSQASDGENDTVRSQGMDCNFSENEWCISSNELVVIPQENTPPAHARMRRNAYTQAARKITLETLENHRQRKWAEFQYSKQSLKKVIASLSSNTPKHNTKDSWNHFEDRCWLCKHLFYNRFEYVSHIMHHIRNIDRCDYRCLFPGCLHGFKNEEDLVLHEQLHSGGMHLCLICASSFLSSCELLEHEWWYHPSAVNDLAQFRQKFCINEFRNAS